MPLRPDMEPAEFLDILRRKKWMILFSVLVILFGATVYCVLAPELYQSTMKIRIIPPVVPEGIVRSTVNIGSKDLLVIIQQEIFSRKRLMEVIGDFGLAREDRKEMSEDAMVEILRKRVILDMDRNNTVLLSFEHEDPKTAQAVTSRLGSFFIEENSRRRGAATQGTANFLESQLAETRKKLEEQEDRLKRYKTQFGGELPEQMQANLGRLTRLQEIIRTNSEAITRMEDRKAYMEAQISNLENQIRAAGSFPDDTGSVASIGSAESYDPALPFLSELASRKKKLEDLATKYTSLHPSVVQARTQVEQLEAKIAELRKAARQAEGRTSGGSAKPSLPSPLPGQITTNWEDKEIRRLRGQVAAIEYEIVAKKKENANTAHTIDVIQAKVERLPQREQELVSLTRDYGNIKSSYEDLLKKKLQADISGNLEGKEEGEQFLVLEPANLPTQPVKPDRLRVLVLALMASIVIGAGGAIGLELLDPTLRGSRDFKSFFDLPVLACLPVIQDGQYKRRMSVRRAAVVGGLVSIMGAYLVFLVIYGEKVKSILQIAGGGK